MSCFFLLRPLSDDFASLSGFAGFSFCSTGFFEAFRTQSYCLQLSLPLSINVSGVQFLKFNLLSSFMIDFLSVEMNDQPQILRHNCLLVAPG